MRKVLHLGIPGFSFWNDSKVCRILAGARDAENENWERAQEKTFLSWCPLRESGLFSKPGMSFSTEHQQECMPTFTCQMGPMIVAVFRLVIKLSHMSTLPE